MFCIFASIQIERVSQPQPNANWGLIFCGSNSVFRDACFWCYYCAITGAVEALGSILES
jgi:hypothetical protein